MSTIIRRLQPTPAIVIAVLALIVAMSGSAVAAVSLTTNSVKSRHIVDGQVKRNDVRANAVIGEKVKDASLSGADVEDNSLTGADVAEASLQGLMPSPVRTVTNQTGPVQFGASVAASCAPTEKAIGGGASWLLPGGDTPTELEAPITASMPIPAGAGTDNLSGWRAAGRNLAGANRVLRVYAICVQR